MYFFNICWNRLTNVVVSTAASHLSALLLPSHNNRDAISACNSLNESLLPTHSNETFSDIVNLLKYQVFLGNFRREQEFWVSSDGSSCRVVNTEGAVKPALCAESLPVLCSQSAGFGAGPTAKTEVTLKTNSLTVTGYVTASKLYSISQISYSVSVT